MKLEYLEPLVTSEGWHLIVVIEVELGDVKIINKGGALGEKTSVCQAKNRGSFFWLGSRTEMNGTKE